MKLCKVCSQMLPVESFSFKNTRLGTRAAYCKECNKTYQKNHYKLHKSYYSQKRAANTAKVTFANRKRIIAFLLANPCIDCGESDIRVLEFDHVRGTKSASIGNLLSKAHSWKVIAAEIEKCEIRCANCHKKRTATQFNWYKTHPAPSSIG